MPRSISSKLIAPTGQFGRQSPKPSQKFSRTSFALPSTSSIAPSWHALAHRPQPLHFSSSIWMILRIMILASLFVFFSSGHVFSRPRFVPAGAAPLAQCVQPLDIAFSALPLKSAMYWVFFSYP